METTSKSRLAEVRLQRRHLLRVQHLRRKFRLVQALLRYQMKSSSNQSCKLSCLVLLLLLVQT